MSGRPDQPVRVAVLADFHSPRRLGRVHQHMLDWCRTRLTRLAPDHVVLAGDITHQADPAQARAFLNGLGLDGWTLEFLPGNNEGDGFALGLAGHANARLVEGCRPCIDWPGQAFLLSTATPASMARSLAELERAIQPGRPVLAIAHHYPESLPAEQQDQLQRAADRAAPAPFWWVCGHQHQAGQRVVRGARAWVTAGIDPVKARGSLPEFLVLTWDGRNLTVERERMTLDDLAAPASCDVRLGIAPREPVAAVLDRALREGVHAVQAHHSVTGGPPAGDELAAIERFRREAPDAFLSLHLPGLAMDDNGPIWASIEPHLAWARDARVDDLTVHLPSVNAEQVFDDAGRPQPTAFARAVIETYARLARTALDAGAQLSIENCRNTPRAAAAGLENRLSGRPEHLLWTLGVLREHLAADGVGPTDMKRLGVTFDFGHAFNDFRVAKQIGVGAWLVEIGPWVQVCHAHQVCAGRNGQQNHNPIDPLEGPLVNYAGGLAFAGQLPRERTYIVVEVRDLDEAIASWRVLTRAWRTLGG